MNPLDALDADDRREDLEAQAWRLAAQALEDGKLRLKNGKTIELDGKDLLRHIHWLAADRKRKPKHVSLPPDALLKPTA